MGPEVSAAVIQHEVFGTDVGIRCRFVADCAMGGTKFVPLAIPDNDTVLLLGLGDLGVRLRHP